MPRREATAVSQCQQLHATWKKVGMVFCETSAHCFVQIAIVSSFRACQLRCLQSKHTGSFVDLCDSRGDHSERFLIMASSCRFGISPQLMPSYVNGNPSAAFTCHQRSARSWHRLRAKTNVQEQVNLLPAASIVKTSFSLLHACLIMPLCHTKY